MCGICGFAGDKNEGLLRAMAGSLAHRGPDEDGFFYDEERVSLGMRRLKVIDLATGSQPVFNEDRTVAVVFNGEIYNYRELRAELRAQGHRFATNSDTEVLVHLYERHGDGFPKFLRGMFAFALWDAKERKLLLGRDQFGIKPLYYAAGGGKFYFASELKALMQVPGLGDELDPGAIDAYFSLLYIPAPLSAFKRVKKLEPAQVLVFKDGRTEIKTYWTLTGRGEPPTGRELLGEIDRLLGASVREQLVADVPLGLLLSGGLDSGALLYYMTGAGAKPVKTFTAGYGPEDATFDETAGARLLAGRFGSDHAESVMRPDIAETMRALAAQFDEPFADASAIPTYMVTRAARQKVTVALTGIGGDEFFGGYPRHLGARLLPAYLRLPKLARRAFWTAASRFPESSSAFNLPGRAKRFLRGGLADFRSGYESWTSYFTAEERAALYSHALRGAGLPSGVSLPGRLAGPDDIFAYEVRNYLSDDLLCLADRASMANSLELRVPFLDTRLAELMASVPLSVKTGGFELKRLLRRVMAGRLPEETLAGPKRGFQVPLARWQGGEIKDFLAEVLSDASVARSGFLDPAGVRELLKEHRSGRRNLGDQVYAAAMFELWLSSLKRRPGSFSPGGITLRRPLKILVCTDIIQSDDEGGSGRVAWETSTRLAAAGHRVAVLTRGAKGKPRRETCCGVEILRHFSSPLKLFGAVREIEAAWGKPDLLYLHHPFTGLLARLIAGPVPAVYMFHSPWGLEYGMRAADQGYSFLRRTIGTWVRKSAERVALALSGRIHAASRFMAGKLKAEHGRDAEIIPLGVDTEKFRPAPDRAALRLRLGLPADAFIALSIRNLVGRMGLENLVEAAALLAEQKKDLLLVIGGRGYLKPRLEALIAERGLAGKVRLAGFIPDADLTAYYQCADVFILPTRALEGFGLVTLEAMACGTPVLATPVAANPEVLGPFDSGMLLKGGEAGDIADGISDFMDRHGRGDEALRARCRIFAESLSWEKYAARQETEFYAAAGKNP
jgi:asparagine synthase (glutamine-hydrolysing)